MLCVALALAVSVTLPLSFIFLGSFGTLIGTLSIFLKGACNHELKDISKVNCISQLYSDYLLSFRVHSFIDLESNSDFLCQNILIFKKPRSQLFGVLPLNYSHDQNLLSPPLPLCSLQFKIFPGTGCTPHTSSSLQTLKSKYSYQWDATFQDQETFVDRLKVVIRNKVFYTD